MRTLASSRELESKMTRLQAALQQYLRAHSGETITREQLCAAVWQMNYFRWSRTIDQTVSVVRKHLAEGERIVTVFGVGYRHELPANRLDSMVLSHTNDLRTGEQLRAVNRSRC